jgi:hypothetical protein
MSAIARDLGCAAVRVTGGDIERLAVAANCAADGGLDVWFSPFPCELDSAKMLALLESSATLAEQLRTRTARKVVFVTGCEVSVFGRGFLPGDNAYRRMEQLNAPGPELFAEYPRIIERFNAFLSNAASVVRSRFAGPITYASELWEQVDWTPFDILGVDAYRDRSNAATFEEQLSALAGHSKAVAVTEFGCCTYRGAADRGAAGWMIVEGAGEDQRLDRDYIRDEGEQVTYARELLDIYRHQRIDAAFWFTFASWNRPHRQDPATDLDLASFGIVRVIDGGALEPSNCWTPKAAFEEIARAARTFGSPSNVRRAC